MGALKAPGSDGFQKHRDLVAGNMYNLIFEDFDGKGRPPNSNDTFLY